MNRFSDNSGFTLLEMILSIFIFAVIMVILVSAMFTIQQSLKKVSDKSDQLDKYLVLERVFDSSFRNAIPFYWKDNNNSRRSIFSGEANKISFAYKHRIVGSEDGGIRFIQFFQEGDKLIALYKKIPILPWDQSTLNSANREVLASGVNRITFSYASRNGNDIVWKNYWNTSNNTGGYNDIPLAIQITITWNDGTSECFLRRTAGSGQFESLGVRVDDAWGN